MIVVLNILISLFEFITSISHKFHLAVADILHYLQDLDSLSSSSIFAAYFGTLSISVAKRASSSLKIAKISFVVPKTSTVSAP
jgi:hypothetical protein